MKSLQELYANTPIQVIVDFYIQNNTEVCLLEGKIHNGDSSAIEELETLVAKILDEIENFEGKECFESAYLKRMQMLVRTKQILQVAKRSKRQGKRRAQQKL
jgi:hypothetical protein